jgi:hypothetical protein
MGQIALATLVSLRDNLILAYTAISESPTTSYSMGERSFNYSDRSRLWTEINRLERLICMRDTTIKARGQSRASFENFS